MAFLEVPGCGREALADGLRLKMTEIDAIRVAC